MSRDRLLRATDRWFRLVLLLYPVDFRDEMGHALAESYRDRARAALDRGGMLPLSGVWLRALRDSLWSGPRERLRPAAAWRRAGHWGRDVERASRRLVRAPALTLAMVGTLTVGLGAFAVVYTVVQRILIDPMPYRDADDLYFVWRDYRAFFDLDRGWLGGTDVAALQEAGGAIEDAVGLRRQSVTLETEAGGDPMEITRMVASPGLFELLGVAPMLGRGFAPDEVGAGRPAVTVLAHDLWTRLGADPAIVGRRIRMNDEPFTVIGVMPADFAFVQHASLGTPGGADAFTTFDIDLATTNPNAGSYSGLVRARRGTPPDAVAASIDAVGRMVDARDFRSRGLKLCPVGLREDLIAGIRPALVVLGAAGAFLVLVLMVNLASVLLARVAEREHEFAVSRALGANSRAIVRATLAEGGVLGLAGGAAGALAAVWGTRALLALAPLDLPRREAIGVDWRIGAVVMAVGAVLGLLAAAGPALWSARVSLRSLLAASAVRGGGGHGRMRRGLIVVQVALSLVLLCAGALVVRSFDRLLQADPGFRADGLYTARIPMPAQLVPDAAEAAALQDRIVEAMAGIPGVTGVSAADTLPLTAGASQNTLRIPGAPGNTGNAERDAPLVDYLGVRAGYIEVMDIQLVEGRGFERARREGVREAVIDEQLARQFFPDGSPLGATFPFDDTNVTVVGVMRQARLYDTHVDGRPQIFLRAEEWGYRSLSYVLRTSRDPDSLLSDLRVAVRQVAPRLPLTDTQSMYAIVAGALRQPRLSAVLLSGFALGALLLATMGLFGVVAGSVTRRRHEVAVRLALGATPGRVLRVVLAEGAGLVGLGIALGIPGVYLAGGLVRGVLVGVSPWDLPTLATVAAGLAGVTIGACYVPARRVLRIDPAASLRQS
jgi:putative ABC transport system permease protein